MVLVNPILYRLLPLDLGLAEALTSEAIFNQNFMTSFISLLKNPMVTIVFICVMVVTIQMKQFLSV